MDKITYINYLPAAMGSTGRQPLLVEPDGRPAVTPLENTPEL